LEILNWSISVEALQIERAQCQKQRNPVKAETQIFQPFSDWLK